MRASFILLLLILCQSSAWAALKWERLRADLSPVLNEKSVETEFAFVNEGQVPVTIESIKSSCGCTSAVTGKKTYAPGEKGEVRARFTIGQRRGQQNKTVAVKIQGEPAPVVLTLAVMILDAVKVTPALVFWEKGEANKTKEIAIAASPGQTINAVKVTSSDPRIRANVETVREGQNYVIRVSPESTETAGFAVLNIEAALAGETMKLRAHAQIKSTAQ